MRLLILLSLIAFAGCTPNEKVVYVKPQIPAETLQPCPISGAAPATVNELATAYVTALGAAECANGKITSIATILKGAPK